jgi:hypothetical protein
MRDCTCKPLAPGFAWYPIPEGLGEWVFPGGTIPRVGLAQRCTSAPSGLSLQQDGHPPPPLHSGGRFPLAGRKPGSAGSRPTSPSPSRRHHSPHEPAAPDKSLGTYTCCRKLERKEEWVDVAQGGIDLRDERNLIEHRTAQGATAPTPSGWRNGSHRHWFSGASSSASGCGGY